MDFFKTEFVMSCSEVSDFPESDLPEIAFVGRSNVGKSTLLNTLVRRKNLARVSSAPGKTRQINYYLTDESCYFVDMPGFGYAKVKKAIRDEWTKLNFSYLDYSENLELVCALIDSRHDPTSIDLALIERLENRGRNYVLILTKSDKISSKLIAERKAQVDHLVKDCRGAVETLPYSALSGLGREELRAIIKRFCVRR